jgi:Fe2+ transport system protein B
MELCGLSHSGQSKTNHLKMATIFNMWLNLQLCLTHLVLARDLTKLKQKIIKAKRKTNEQFPSILQYQQKIKKHIPKLEISKVENWIKGFGNLKDHTQTKQQCRCQQKALAAKQQKTRWLHSCCTQTATYYHYK